MRCTIHASPAATTAGPARATATPPSMLPPRAVRPVEIPTALKARYAGGGDRGNRAEGPGDRSDSTGLASRVARSALLHGKSGVITKYVARGRHRNRGWRGREHTDARRRAAADHGSGRSQSRHDARPTRTGDEPPGGYKTQRGCRRNRAPAHAAADRLCDLDLRAQELACLAPTRELFAVVSERVVSAPAELTLGARDDLVGGQALAVLHDDDRLDTGAPANFASVPIRMVAASLPRAIPVKWITMPPPT